VVVGAGRQFGGSLSESFAAAGVAVLLCCTAPGVAVKPHGQSRGLKLERGGYALVHMNPRCRWSHSATYVSE
jgi:hypothetical protein